MDEEYENFIRFRCLDAIKKAGIDANNINLDACVQSYKTGFMEVVNLLKNNGCAANIINKHM